MLYKTNGKHFRQSFQGINFRREPRRGGRLHYRRLSVDVGAFVRRHSIPARQAQTRSEFAHDAARRSRRLRNPFGRLRGQDAGDAHLRCCAQQKPALARLLRNRKALASVACRLHIRRQVRLARPARRRQKLRPRDNRARGGGGCCAEISGRRRENHRVG